LKNAVDVSGVVRIYHVQTANEAEFGTSRRASRKAHFPPPRRPLSRHADAGPRESHPSAPCNSIIMDRRPS